MPPAPLPDHHPQTGFFVCDLFDASPTADTGPMEHPVFSLATRPDTRPRRYVHNGVVVEVTSSPHGLATVHDRDVLIHCISQMVRAMNDGRDVSRTVRFRASDFLRDTHRMRTGRGYDLLKAALERLAGTRISTNITTDSRESFETFSLIEDARILHEPRDGRMQEIAVTLPERAFTAIRAQAVLTLSPAYFRLRKPLERCLYGLARKHCGHQSEWRIDLENLQEKCGSGASLSEFRRMVSAIASKDIRDYHMPDYALRYDGEADVLLVTDRRIPGPDGRLPAVQIRPLDSMAYELARKAVPGRDVRHIEAAWRAAATVRPRQPEIDFLAFCRTWAAQGEGM